MKPPRDPPYKQHARYWMRVAVARAGTENNLAKATGVTQQAISLARRYGRCSGELAVKIHHWSGGEVGANRLRPDLWDKPEHVPKRPIEKVIVHPVVVRGSS